MDAAFHFSFCYFFETDVVFLNNLTSKIEKNTFSNKSSRVFKYNLNICFKLDSMLFILLNKIMLAI